MAGKRARGMRGAQRPAPARACPQARLVAVHRRVHVGGLALLLDRHALLQQRRGLVVLVHDLFQQQLPLVGLRGGAGSGRGRWAAKQAPCRRRTTGGGCGRRGSHCGPARRPPRLHLLDGVDLVAAQAVVELAVHAARAVGGVARGVGAVQHLLLARGARLDVLRGRRRAGAAAGAAACAEAWQRAGQRQRSAAHARQPRGRAAPRAAPACAPPRAAATARTCRGAPRAAPPRPRACARRPRCAPRPSPRGAPVRARACVRVLGCTLARGRKARARLSPACPQHRVARRAAGVRTSLAASRDSKSARFWCRIASLAASAPAGGRTRARGEHLGAERVRGAPSPPLGPAGSR